MTAYGAQPDLAGVLMIGVSQSGGSPDLVQSLEVRAARGALTIAITNQSESALALAAEAHIDIQAGKEGAAATKSYTAQLLALYLLFDRPGRQRRVGGRAQRPRWRSCSARTSMSPNWPSAIASLRGWSAQRVAIPIQRLGRPR